LHPKKEMKWLVFALVYLNSSFLFSQQAELLVQLGHSDRVSCLDYSIDGKYIITAGSDKMIKLWQVNNGLMVRTFKGHMGSVYDIKLSKDAKTIYSCSWDDKKLLKWDVSTGKILKQYINSKTPVTGITLSNDGKFIAGVCEDGIMIFKSADLSFVKKVPIKDPALVQYSIDDKLLYIANKEYDKEKLFILDIALNKVTEGFKIIYSPEMMTIAGRKLLLSNYKSVVCFDLDSKKTIFTKNMDEKRISTSTISAKGDKIAYGFEDGTIKISIVDGVEITLDKKHTSFVNKLQFSPDDQFLATACGDWSSKIYSVASGQVVRDLKTQSEFIAGISLNGTGNYLAFASGNLESGNHIGVWNVNRGKLFPFYTSVDVSSFFSGVAFSQKNKSITASNVNGSTYSYDFPTGNSANINTGNGPVTCVTFTPNGKNIISGTKTGSLIFWRPDRNKNEVIDSDKEGISSVAVSNNAAKVAVATFNGKLLIYSYDSKTLERTISSHDISSGYYDTTNVMAYGSVTNFSMDGNFAMKYASIMGLAFSADNSMVATCGGNWIKIFNVQSGELIKHIKQNGAGFCSVNFSADGETICSAGADFNVRLYDVATGNLKQTFKGHQNEVRDVIFSTNQKYLISGSFDTQIKIWDIATGKEILSYIVLAGGNDYVIHNPQGYYFSTKGASKVLSFRIGNEVFPFEQFDLKYNRPDIILNDISKFVYSDSKDNPNVQLIKSYYAAYQKRLKRSGFTEAQLGSDFHVPTISINTASIPISWRQPLLSFEIKANDDLYDLSYVNVWVNDVPVYGVKGMAVTGKTYSKNCEIALSNERNKVTVSCINSKGVESYKESFEITYEGGKANYKTYFIGIAVSNYLDTNFNLKYTVKDIEDISTALKEKYPDADITLLKNEQVTKQAVLALKEKLLKTGVNDKVIISLSGHGLLSKDLDFYYATHNIDFNHPEKNGLLYEDLESILDGIPARNKLILVDACHSGEVDKSETIEFADTVLARDVSGISTKGAKLILNKNTVGLENSFELMQELFSDVSKGNGAVVISASGGKEYALESSKWNNGVFTFCVLNGLKDANADKNGDRIVSVNELKTYVSFRVQNLTAGQQKPTSRRENLVNDWGIW